MNTELNCITIHRYIDEGGEMENIIVIVVEFGLMSEIFIFGVIYVKDIDFWREQLITSKIVIFAFGDVKDDYFDVQWSGMTKITISDYPNEKDDDNQSWKLLDVKDHYFICFVLGEINIFDIPNSST